MKKTKSNYGYGIARLIETENMADMNRKPEIKILPGHWNYLISKSELAFLQSTDIQLEVLDHLYWYNDRYKFFVNWKLNNLLLRVSDAVTKEDILNMDIPLDPNELHYLQFEVAMLHNEDFIIGLDEKDDLTVYKITSGAKERKQPTFSR